MSHAISYKLVQTSDQSSVACEIHINGQLAAILSWNEEYALHPAKDFTDRSVSPEQMQSAVEGAMEKLQSPDLNNIN